MKSQDLIEDSSKIPEGRKINWDFHFSGLFSTKNIKRLKYKKTPCGCNFCFIAIRSGSNHERKSTLILIRIVNIYSLLKNFNDLYLNS